MKQSMRLVCVSALILSVFTSPMLVTPVRAEKYVSGNESFSITFPEGWEFDTNLGGVYAEYSENGNGGIIGIFEEDVNKYYKTLGIEPSQTQEKTLFEYVIPEIYWVNIESYIEEATMLDLTYRDSGFREIGGIKAGRIRFNVEHFPGEGELYYLTVNEYLYTITSLTISLNEEAEMTRISEDIQSTLDSVTFKSTSSEPLQIVFTSDGDSLAIAMVKGFIEVFIAVASFSLFLTVVRWVWRKVRRTKEEAQSEAKYKFTTRDALEEVVKEWQEAKHR